MSGEKQEDNKTKDHYESESIDNNKDKSHPEARKNIKDKIIGKIASTITMDESEEDTNLSGLSEYLIMPGEYYWVYLP